MKRILLGRDPYVSLAAVVLECAVKEAIEGSVEATRWVRGESLWFDIFRRHLDYVQS